MIERRGRGGGHERTFFLGIRRLLRRSRGTGEDPERAAGQARGHTVAGLGSIPRDQVRGTSMKGSLCGALCLGARWLGFVWWEMLRRVGEGGHALTTEAPPSEPEE